MNIEINHPSVTVLTCAISVALSGFSVAGDLPMVVAHRGASHDAPENTLAAFRLAWAKGADAIEGDFFLTKDAQIVCTHDRHTERLNKEKKKLVVAKSTLAQLRELDVGSWKDAQWQGERMPTLQQVLRTVPAGKQIFIEVKCGAEILPHLKKQIGQCALKAEQISIISFQKEVIAGAKKSLPDIKAYWLTGFERDKKTGKVSPTTPSILKTLAELNADGLDCGDHDSLTAKQMEEIRAKGYETHCWTVDDPQRARELVAMGMQSVTTNRPGLIREALAAGKELRK